MTYFYGLDAELQKKQESKFDPKRAQEAKQWIQTILKEPLPNGDFVASLQNGIILATLVNKITGNSTPVSRQNMAFMQMENINTFLLGAMALGVPKSDLFQTVDLYELKNPAQVVNGIFAFARHASKKYPSLPTLGPKLSEKHSVVFTEEQKRAGAYVPSQQTGHHAGIIAQERGATQSGMNYGQSRQIKNEKVSTGDESVLGQQTGYYAAVNAQNTGATQSGMIYGKGREISSSVSSGSYVPSQQTGYGAAINAKATGATQSGLIFGKSREIVTNRY